MNSEVEYHDLVSVGNKSLHTAAVHYRGDWNIKDYQPLWSFLLDTEFNIRSINSVIYPYYRTDNLSYMEMKLTGEKNWLSGANLFSLSFAIGYDGGLNEKMEEGSYIVNPTQNKPKLAEQMYLREHEFMMMSKAGFTPKFSYTRKFKKFSLFVQTSYSYHRSLIDVKYLRSSALI